MDTLRPAGHVMSDTTDSSSEREPDATSGVPGGPGGEERDEAFLTQASNLVKTLKQGVVVTGERVHETIEDAVRRGRMTRKDAQELAAAIVSASRRQTDELRHELELLLERGKARKGRAGEGESAATTSSAGATSAAAAGSKAKADPAKATTKAEPAAKSGSAAAKPKAGAAKGKAAKAKASAAAAKGKPAKATAAGSGKAAAKAKPATAPAKTKAGAAKASAKSKAAPPFAGYDELTAAEVGKRLAGLSATELAAVRGYEAAHAKRKTVLAAVDRRLAG